MVKSRRVFETRKRKQNKEIHKESRIKSPRRFTLYRVQLLCPSRPRAMNNTRQ